MTTIRESLSHGLLRAVNFGDDAIHKFGKTVSTVVHNKNAKSPADDLKGFDLGDESIRVEIVTQKDTTQDEKVAAQDGSVGVEDEIFNPFQSLNPYVSHAIGQPGEICKTIDEIAKKIKPSQIENLSSTELHSISSTIKGTLVVLNDAKKKLDRDPINSLDKNMAGIILDDYTSKAQILRSAIQVEEARRKPSIGLERANMDKLDKLGDELLKLVTES